MRVESTVPQPPNGLVMDGVLLKGPHVLLVVLHNALVVPADQKRAVVSPGHRANRVAVGLSTSATEAQVTRKLNEGAREGVHPPFARLQRATSTCASKFNEGACEGVHPPFSRHHRATST